MEDSLMKRHKAAYEISLKIEEIDNEMKDQDYNKCNVIIENFIENNPQFFHSYFDQCILANEILGIKDYDLGYDHVEDEGTCGKWLLRLAYKIRDAVEKGANPQAV